MRVEVRNGPLYALLRVCWVKRDNLGISCEYKNPKWATEPLLKAVVVESVKVEEEHRREGHFTRFLNQLIKDRRFKIVIVQAVQNSILAEALLRWGWDCNPAISDYYWRKGENPNSREGNTNSKAE